MNANDTKLGPEGAGPVRCADVQASLQAYVDRELGEGRMDLMREHLRQCPACQRAAVELQQTLEALKGASSDAGPGAGRLSERRRARIRWSINHPLLDWIYRHHVWVSVVTAVVVLAVIVLVLQRVRPDWLKWERTGVEITIGQGEAPHE